MAKSQWLTWGHCYTCKILTYLFMYINLDFHGGLDFFSTRILNLFHHYLWINVLRKMSKFICSGFIKYHNECVLATMRPKPQTRKKQTVNSCTSYGKLRDSAGFNENSLRLEDKHAKWQILSTHVPAHVPQSLPLKNQNYSTAGLQTATTPMHQGNTQGDVISYHIISYSAI